MDYSLLQIINIIQSDITSKKIESKKFITSFHSFKDKWDTHFEENKDVELYRSVINSPITYQEWQNLDRDLTHTEKSVTSLNGKGVLLLKDFGEFQQEFDNTIFQQYLDLISE